MDFFKRFYFNKFFFIKTLATYKYHITKCVEVIFYVSDLVTLLIYL
jgi:hypothetical protein